MNKPNFPAQYELKKNGRIKFVCTKHLGPEIQSGATDIEQLPDDSQISCVECEVGRINS